MQAEDFYLMKPLSNFLQTSTPAQSFELKNGNGGTRDGDELVSEWPSKSIRDVLKVKLFAKL